MFFVSTDPQQLSHFSNFDQWHILFLYNLTRVKQDQLDSVIEYSLDRT